MPEHASPLLRLKAFLDRIGIGDWFTAYRTDEPTAARFRARQLQAVTRMTPLAMGANLANVALVVTVFWSTPSRDASLVWASVVTFVALTALYRWHVKRRAVARDIASRRALRRATAHAAILAACWAMLPLLLHANAPAREQMLVTTVVAGMLGAGGFMLATVPMAATAYVIVMAFGAAAALLYSSLDLPPQMGGLLTAYCVIIIGSIWSTARLFGARLMAEAEAERQNEVIGLLLRDFEEHASDVLWDIGADGRLRQVSPRLTELFGLRPEQLIGASALDLLASLTPDDDEAREHLGKLRALAKAREPFRDQLIAVQRNGQTHWWSLSAKPLRDAQGHHAGWRGVASDVTDARNAHHQLRWLAHNDALTGLANRHQFRHLAAQRLGDEGAGAIAVLCLDLDHFKTVNDSLGHAAGDALLRRVGERLRAATRRSDIVARLGGDEFAVLMHAANTIEIELMAARLIEALREPCEIDGMRVDSRASIGVAIAQRDGRDIDTLMNHADLSLYAAKAAGRDEVRFFTPDLARSSRRRVMLEQALRQALARHELRLVFQPVGSFAAWEVLGFEALLRWQHADLGDVPPAEFIPVAEEAGLMPAIGGWVLDEACRQAAGWVAPMMVSVNVSPMQMMVPAFVERVRDAAMSAGLPLWRLELEITESVLLQETQSTGDTLRSLHRAGVRMALDDFGTGYSALSYLRRFPLHTLKIDRSFVRELSSRSDAREIVKMIVGLARTLDMRTIAEGVEEPAHATLLARDGCGAMQGWLLSAPLEADEVSPFLRGWPTRPRPLFEAMAPAWARPEGIAR